MSTLFISHSSRNNEQAVKVRDWLRTQGWTEIFLDFDPQAGIVPGRRWREELKKAGARCSAILVLISQEWLASKECWDEFRLASELGKEIFPCLISPFPPEDLPEELRAYQFADISTADREVSGLERLYIGLKQAGLLPDSFHWPPTDEPTRLFYPGLRALEEQDAAIFFGRDLQITKGLDCIRRMRDGAPERMLVILGASGAGKSSFLKAGLLARLQRDTLRFHTLPCLRPSRSPLTGPAGFQHVLGMDLPLDTTSVLARLDQLRTAAIEERRRYLADHEAGASLTPPTIILPIDQAEELFTVATDEDAEAATVIALLAEIVKHDPNLLILATIRSDSFNLLQNEQQLEAIPKLPFDLPKMAQPALKEIIEGPAKLVDLKIDADLTEQLLQDFSGADALPLLACTLERLFVDYGDDGRLEKQEYLEKMKGVGGAILRSVEIAFAHALEHRDLPDSREELDQMAQRCFVPGLVRIDDPAAAPKRRVMLRHDLPPEAQPLIDCFIEQRLLVADEEEAGPTVEVAHEAILRHWPDLATWIAERRDDLFRAEGVMAAARDWREAPEATRTESLVHRGERLQAAEGLLLWEDAKKLLGDSAIAYLTACRDEETRIEVAAAAQERRQRRFRQWITGLVVAGAVVTVVGAALVVMGQRNLGRAQSLTLARTAERLIEDGDHLRAVRLSLLAVHRNFLEPSVQESLTALTSSAQNLRLTREFRRSDGDQITGAAFFKGRSFVIAWNGWHARLWNVITGEETEILIRTNGNICSTDNDYFIAKKKDSAQLVDMITGIDIGSPIKLSDEDRIDHFTYSKEKNRILTWAGNMVRIWDVTTGKQVGASLVHGTMSGVFSASFCCNGNRILTQSSASGSDIHLWSANDGRKISENPIKANEPIKNTHFSKDKNRILTWTNESVHIWDLNKNEQAGPSFKHDNEVRGALFANDESRILTWAKDGPVHYWDASTGKHLELTLKHEDSIKDVLLSKDKSNILVWSWDGSMRLWDVNTGTQIGPTLYHGSVINGVRFSRDENSVLSWGSDGTVRLWDINTGKQIGPLLKHDNSVEGAIFSENEALILSWDRNGKVRLWDTNIGGQIGPSFVHKEPVKSARFSKDEADIFTWSLDGTARHWKTANRNQVGSTLELDNQSNKALFSNTGTHVLTWGLDNMARLWKIFPERQLKFSFKHENEVLGASFSNDEKRILTWSNQSAHQWDATSGKQIGASFNHEQSIIYGATYSKKNDRIFTWGQDGTVRQWDAKTSNQIGILIKHDGQIVDAIFSNNENRILTYDMDESSAHLWDLSTGKQIEPPLNHGRSIFGACFSNDGSRILTWSMNDHNVHVWDANTNIQIRPSLEHDSAVKGAVFSKDGNHIFSWGTDKQVRLWDANSGVQIGLPFNHGESVDGVNGVVFSEDENSILTWAEDATARLWNVRWAMRNPEHSNFIPDLCREKLFGTSTKKKTTDGREILVGVRHIDEIDVKAAPILRGREGEEVCAPPPTTWQTLLTLIRGH